MPRPSRPSRREMLGGLIAAPFVLSARARAELAFPDYPFPLGVAAGDMTSDGFVVWTRLAPRPLDPHGGMPAKPVMVDWEIGLDRDFQSVATKGSATAWPEFGHSLHIEVDGLAAATRYFYRCLCAGAYSATGVVTTLPDSRSAVASLRFASVGCQHFEQGWYTAYRDVAQQPLDFVFHYGDYIYENGIPPNSGQPGWADPVRRYSGPVPISLDDYRSRYIDTKLDPDLQQAHAATGWYCTYDDHEVENNWASIYDAEGDPPAMFRLRRNAALQAWYEHMPVRRASVPTADGIVDFRRRVDFGDLARFHMPNTRLYRSDQPCGDGFVPDCPGRHAPGQDMLGEAQWRWLQRGFATSRQCWNLLLQQVMVAMPDRRQGTESRTIFNMDSWAGYPAAQARLLELFARHKRGNIVVVTGDEHRHYANDLIKGDRIVASELVSTSISSQGDGAVPSDPAAMLAHNSFIKFISDKRGYVLTEVTHERTVADFRVVERVTSPDMPVTSATRFAIMANKGGLQRI